MGEKSPDIPGKQASRAHDGARLAAATARLSFWVAVITLVTALLGLLVLAFHLA